MNAGKSTAPETNTEFLIYQTLIGAWPLDTAEVPEFKTRMKDYMIKAVREAKAITSWININREYEEAIIRFIDAILQNSADNEFLIDFLEFQEKTAYYGALNSLAQTLLKITLPGLPDFYQGNELWDFNLVDPDNRRPVDFRKRQDLLSGLLEIEKTGKSLITDMLAHWRDGRIKLYVIYKALNYRRDHPNLFQRGDYIPLRLEGRRQENVFAFTRCHDNKWVLVAVPRFFTGLTDVESPPCGKRVWGDDRTLLPDGSPQNWFNVFSGEILHVRSGSNVLLTSEVFQTTPVALFIPQA